METGADTGAHLSDSQPVSDPSAGYCRLPRRTNPSGHGFLLSQNFFEEILRKNEIAWDTLSVSCETGQAKVDAAQSLGLERFGVVSADFKGFLRPLEKHGARPIYYRAPVQLMQDALHPGISNDFKERYDAICGARVFSGRKRPSFLYELGCLCAGPLLYSLYSFFDADFTICYAASHSCFAKMTHPTRSVP